MPIYITTLQSQLSSYQFFETKKVTGLYTEISRLRLWKQGHFNIFYGVPRDGMHKMDEFSVFDADKNLIHN